MAFTFRQATQTIAKANLEELQQITCVVDNFLYRDEETGFFVLSARVSEGQPNVSGIVNGKNFSGRKFTAVGTSLMAQSIVAGQEIDVWGNFEQGRQAGSIQFTTKSIQEKVPTSPKAIELFLSSGKIYGIGPKTAKKIVQAFGPKTIEILDASPDDLLDVEGVNQKKLEMIKQSWQEWRGVYEIVATMRLYGIGDASGVKIFNHFKEKAIHIIKNEPYDLTDVPTIGFKTADRIAQQIGKSSVDEKRIEKCLLYTLEEISESGHTAFAKDELAEKTNNLLEIDINLINNKIVDLIERDLLIEKPIRIKIFDMKDRTKFTLIDKIGVAHSKIHNAEARIAKELKRVFDFPSLVDSENSQENIENFLNENPYDLDESQLDAAYKILSNKVSILTGGPGTGKTHTIKSLLKYFDSVGNSATYLTGEDLTNQTGLTSILSAPTGRAAKRMEEATKKASSTIHRLLGFKDGQFVHNEFNKLKGDVFIIDEFSMVDIWLFLSLLKALPSDARLIFVGDVNQLESVGAGSVLRDMIESGYIPVTRLKVIHRQALNSNIIVASHDIINSKVPAIHSIDSDSDFVFLEKDTPEDIHDSILNLVSSLLKKGVNSDDIQILSPKKDSQVGTYNLNTTLRPLLNLEYPKYENTDYKFVPGDRVMQFKNNKDLDIFNGDIGKVKNINKEDSSLNIFFDDKLLEISGQDISNLNLSYAITIHKSQGSDYPYVIIPLSRSHSFMWDANLLYTAVTRGKKRVILVGDKKTLFMSVASFKQKVRITGLKDEIIKVFEEDINLTNESKSFKLN